MVLGSRTNNRRSPTLQRDFLINIQEIKPWPPSQSLRTLRSVLIQWEHGEKYSGSTNTVIPLLGSGIGDGKIEFNESFKISITLVRDIGKGGDNATFQKSILELNLYEPRRDKTAKGQLLGTAIVDFAEYGVVKKAQNISVPINSKRIYNNASKPLIFLRIQSIERGRTSSSSRESLSRVLSMERNGGESVSALMNEEYAEEAETASVTDDDVSSISSMTLSNSAHETSGGLSPQTNEVMNDISSEVQNLIPTQQLVQGETKQVEEIHEKENVKDDNGALFASETGIGSLNGSEDNTTIFSDHETKSVDNITDNGHLNIIGENKFQENEYDGEAVSEGENSNNDEKSKEFSKDDNMEQESCPSDAITPSEEKLEFNNSTIPFNKLNHVKSVRSFIESGKSNGSIRIGKLENDYNSPLGFTSHGKKESKFYTKETNNTYSDGKVLQLERRIKMLEGELREAAGIEVGLYSIVAEHGSSTNKVHAPARRLSRLYLYACKDSSTSRRESAARSAVSGLVVVSKACGNDVPRLTYWLSNTVVLRAIIQQQLPLYAGSSVKRPNGGNCIHKKVSPLKWKESSKFVSQNFDDWKDPRTFTSALEKIEGWIFSRVIESIWWQTLTPHMQSAATKAINTDIALAESNSYRRTFSSGDQDHVDISLELWKKAFKDACERLCPVRGEGHECGCLPVLARLIMEQCVARLDVAMFNAILRESDDEIPTDPISDPISDAKVLPIPAGKASFGAGAQLKNAIGNWSRWLTDLFGIDDDSHRESNIEDQDDKSDDGDHDTSSNSFHLLNALSDLMILPKDMLLNQSIRKEVCPTFGAPLIKRVLSYFVPDEFCPDLIPEAVIESLDSEDHLEEEGDFVKAFPCNADQIVYTPPKSTSLFSVIGEIGNEYRLRRSGSSVLKKSYTSDDELDELDSPMSSIINGFQGSMSPIRSNESGSSVAVRYQLLREVWLSSE